MNRLFILLALVVGCAEPVGFRPAKDATERRAAKDSFRMKAPAFDCGLSAS